MKRFYFIGLFLASFSFLSNENVEAAGDDKWVIIGKSDLRNDVYTAPVFADCYVDIKKNGKSITGFPEKQTKLTGLLAEGAQSAPPCIIKGEVKDKKSGITLIYDVSAVGFRTSHSSNQGDCNQTVIVTNNEGKVLHRESTADGIPSIKKCGRHAKITYEDGTIKNRTGRPPQ